MTQASNSSALAHTDQRLPLHVRVKDDLIRRVRANEWASTIPLPPESALAEEYGISVGTLRRVLAELAADGILERHQGRAPLSVAPPSSTPCSVSSGCTEEPERHQAAAFWTGRSRKLPGWLPLRWASRNMRPL
ncbi:GntR family transcriptional regulator [Arthrobacter sp. SD76]|uniref:GntR family transcriptional regulator n=1 Tax=Arthrobacter sp. SD76 TaxID=3415007 RepID=UPI003C78FAF0